MSVMEGLAAGQRRDTILQALLVDVALVRFLFCAFRCNDRWFKALRRRGRPFKGRPMQQVTTTTLDFAVYNRVTRSGKQSSGKEIQILNNIPTLSGGL